ncbi:MAG: ABC transporter substrate-binding protein, partial [Novosphingobium sp.]|nr:ABC transporter substrate-binding protein [Novosphingobium sp.]
MPPLRDAVTLPVPRRYFLALLPLILSACAPAERAAAPHLHPTIVSLNPCTDAILAEVADPRQILALSHYSRDPASSSMDVALARRFPAVGDDIEEVLALRPDIVVAGSFVPPPTAAAYRRLGLRLEPFGIAASVAASEAQVRRIAALAGHPERGEALVGRIEAALGRAAPPPGAPPIPTLVWQSGGIVPGEGTLIAELLRRAGFANFAAARGLRQADVLPLEAVLAAPPRLILAVVSPHSEEDRALSHPALGRLASTRRARFDPA